MHTLTSPGLYFLGVVAVWLLAGAVLRHRSPVWHWYIVGYPLTWFRITRTWRPLCIERGLSVSRRASQAVIGDLIVRGQEVRPVVPRLWIGRPTRTGLVVRVRLMPGQTPEEYAQSAEALMHAWRVYAVRITSPERGLIHIEALLSDPLAGVVVRNPDARRAGTTAPAGPPVMVLVVGVTERAKSWLMNFRLVPHWLIVGATRSGKSTLIHAIVTRFAPQGVAIVGIDLKGGLELSVYRPRLSGLATTRQEAVEILEALVELKDERTHACNMAGVRQAWELPEPPPPVVLVIDEVAELFLVTSNRDREEVALRDKTVALLVKLAQLGAALDIHVIAGGQRFGSDLGSGATLLRSQLSGRVCMHVSDGETAVMTLGDIWPEAVVTAQMIRADEQGTAVTGDGEGSWVRARAMFTGVDEAADAARIYSRITPVLPGIKRPYFVDLPPDSEGGEG
ncbi:hypothetical protein KDK95_01420 [Actinospica sp. MGRD01-02]|uniref:FtsK domain-containing protein n=1 Tax=Actinospica acidithermotolerans TaxID=2828514 RepID=A0A941E9C1_9ACTN|nr:FtsK/SpoIIIE domain-containing protein [Actinospica acidithermotolerans]MBR7824949.1 hypothetical protein [Actinospica acidithermotolerans]